MNYFPFWTCNAGTFFINININSHQYGKIVYKSYDDFYELYDYNKFIHIFEAYDIAKTYDQKDSSGFLYEIFYEDEDENLKNVHINYFKNTNHISQPEIYN